MREPKISLGSWAFSFGPFSSNPWSFDKLCKYTAEAGFDGVEINGFRPHPHPDEYNNSAKRSELKRFLADLQLGISGYAPDFHAVPPSEAEMGKYLDVTRKCLEFMHDLGIKILRVDTVTPPNAFSAEEYQKRFMHLVNTWRAAADLCEQAGVTLVWEYEPGFWLNKPSEVLRLVRTVDHPSFKLLFDTSHSYMGSVIAARHTGEREVLPGGLVEYAKQLAPHIGHFHLIDSDGTLHDNETSTHAPFGTGNIEFPPVLDALKPALEKLEWWCLDFCFCSTTEADARKAVPYVRSLGRGLVGV